MNYELPTALQVLSTIMWKVKNTTFNELSAQETAFTLHIQMNKLACGAWVTSESGVY